MRESGVSCGEYARLVFVDLRRDPSWWAGLTRAWRLRTRPLQPSGAFPNGTSTPRGPSLRARSIALFPSGGHRGAVHGPGVFFARNTDQTC